VIRVDRNKSDEVNSTVLFRPKKAQLSDDDKDNLKLLNVCDPYVHEFFFGGRIVVVEGDTEYTAFSQLKLFYPNEYEDVHIIRARGKGVIPSVVKILNQFTANYGVLHDADTEKAANGNANPAWAINTNILTEVRKSPNLSQTLLIACKQNFEDALLKKKVSKDKPYHALSQMKADETFKLDVKKLFDSLLDGSKEPPEDCVRWSNIEELKS
jgi:putative ATP-dependent endonuclease of OLD family